MKLTKIHKNLSHVSHGSKGKWQLNRDQSRVANMGGKRWENFIYWFISNSSGVKTMFKKRWSSYLSLSLLAMLKRLNQQQLR